LEILSLLLTLAVVLHFLYNYVVEPGYMLLFGRPLFVHFYIFPKRLEVLHAALLERDFAFYRSLSARRKRYFEYRIHSFIKKYKFAGRQGLVVTDNMKVKIAATSVMLTFGMRKYLYDVFSTIIVYPNAFPSQRDNNYHKGEFNPAAGIISFSWHDFEEGMRYGNDNLNLGLHEFAHALHFDSLRKRRAGASAVIYKDMFGRIMAYIDKPKNREDLLAANYLRSYAYTNQHEFLAVMLEHFFETPHEFRQKLPELYQMVKKMINFRDPE
jgi:Mlc titration factor MtfA (ptsG expression regulator)